MMASAGRPFAGACRRWASTPLRPAPTKAATCPSPRCSRTTVASCHRSSTAGLASDHPSIGGAERAACHVQAGHCSLQRRHGGFDDRVGHPGVAQAGRGDQSARLQAPRRVRHLPRRGQSPAHHVGVESGEDGYDRLRPDPSQRGGPKREVRLPEPLEADGPAGVGHTGSEISHGVERLEGDPNSVGGMGGHAISMPRPASASNGERNLFPFGPRPRRPVRSADRLIHGSWADRMALSCCALKWG